MSEYLRLVDVSAGMQIMADAGFTCMRPGIKTVQADETGHLYIPCNVGRHYLDGQLDDDERLIGLTAAVEAV